MFDRVHLALYGRHVAVITIPGRKYTSVGYYGQPTDDLPAHELVSTVELKAGTRQAFDEAAAEQIGMLNYAIALTYEG